MGPLPPPQDHQNDQSYVQSKRQKYKTTIKRQKTKRQKQLLDYTTAKDPHWLRHKIVRMIRVMSSQKDKKTKILNKNKKTKKQKDKNNYSIIPQPRTTTASATRSSE